MLRYRCMEENMNEIFTRRSVRNFKDQSIEKEKIEEILRAAMHAPTAMNKQPWKFIVVTNIDVIRKLSKMAMYSMPLETATACVIALGDTTKDDRPEGCNTACSVAIQNLMLQAKSLDIGSCWIGVYPLEDRMEYVKSIVDVADELIVHSLVALGYSEGDSTVVDRFDESLVTYID